MLFRGCAALRFPTRDINSPAAAGVNCQEEGVDSQPEVSINGVDATGLLGEGVVP